MDENAENVIGEQNIDEQPVIEEQALEEEVVYTDEPFDKDTALNGSLVGVNVQDPDDRSSYCGVLKVVRNCMDAPVYTRDDGQKVMAIHQVIIKGSVVWCSDKGVVLNCEPELSEVPVGTQLVIQKASIPVTYGTGQTMTRSEEGQGYTRSIKINELNPRDEFAVHALSVIMGRLEHPESVDDANILQACYTAYRWANGMMLAAADARSQLKEEDEPVVPDGQVDVNADALDSNVERLLYNINATLLSKNAQDKTVVDNGLKLSSVPDLKIAQIPKVMVEELPDVTIGELPEVSVEGFDKVAESYEIPDVLNNIAINVSVYRSKYLRFEVTSHMLYSDVSVYLNLTVTPSGSTTTETRKVSYVLPKGTVVIVESVEDDIDTIGSISSMSIRGKGANDPNTYRLQQSNQ